MHEAARGYDMNLQETLCIPLAGFRGTHYVHIVLRKLRGLAHRRSSSIPELNHFNSKHGINR